MRLSDDGTAIVEGDCLVLPFFAHPDGVRLALPPDPASAPVSPIAAWGARLSHALRRDPDFTAEAGQASGYLLGVADSPDLLAVGLGQEAELGPEPIRLAAMAAAQAARGRVVTNLARIGNDRAMAVRAVAEGILLGRYIYAADTAARPQAGDDVLLLAPGESGDAANRRALEIGLVAGRTANWVRRLVETPGGDLTPAVFAERVAMRARELGMAASTWNADDMSARGFGATAAVGGASRHAPVVVELRHGRQQGGAVLGLAGKGITFDSGGINLKRDPAEIAWMKTDMAAAAAVAGAVFAAVELGAAPDFIAVLPMAENMPGGHAQRPGDVVTHPDGSRTEVTDTDCEGRLVLADAIAYLARQKVAGIIDVGTLTDGGGVGPALWGCWATDDALADELLAAGRVAGEPGWRLPLRPEYRRMLKSKVADLANAPLDAPDTGQMAATYLRHFAGSVPWVHIDNGSSAYLEQELDPWPEGATASPMRALLQLLLNRAQA